MSIFDIFAGSKGTNQAPAQQQQQQQPATPGNMQPPADPPAPGQGQVPSSATQQPAAPTKPESPLDNFKDLWEPVTADPNAPKPTKPEPLTAEQIQKAVAKVNFTQAVTPEHLAAISAGGEKAQEAFAQALNQVAQQVMVQATMVNNKLSENAISAAIEEYNATLPQKLRREQSNSHLRDTSELFSNPAIQPVVKATQEQLLQKYPNATSAEITEMTRAFILAMGEEFAPKPPANPEEQDWSKFLG